MIGMKTAEASVSFEVFQQLNGRNACENQALIAIEDSISRNRKR